jgi:hypothetical protein
MSGRDAKNTQELAAAIDVDALVRVLPVAVDHGIRQGFTKSRLDVDLASIRASKLQNKAHELINELGDGHDSAWERLSQLDEKNRMSISQQGRERRLKVLRAPRDVTSSAHEV